jgi:hypothetical protein
MKPWIQWLTPQKLMERWGCDEEELAQAVIADLPIHIWGKTYMTSSIKDSKEFKGEDFSKIVPRLLTDFDSKFLIADVEEFEKKHGIRLSDNHNQGKIRSHYPRGNPDWTYWEKRNSWSLCEAVCLIHNYDPGKLEDKNHPIYDRYNSPDDPKAQELRATCDAAITAVKLKRLAALAPFDPSRADLYIQVNPGKFITWAKKRGFNVPDALKGLAHRMILDGRELDADHPVLKRIEEREVQEFKKNRPPTRENANLKTIFTAKEIKPISSLEAAENYEISPQQQLSHIDEGKLDPYERIPGDRLPRLEFPSMPPSDAPDSIEPRYRCLQKYERGRLTAGKLKELFYPEHQVSRLKADNDENHERLIWNKFIQPIIDAYDIKTVKYTYNPCSYNPAADNKMRRLLVQMTNKRKPLESSEQPLEKFKQLLRLWAEGTPDEPGCKYKQFFIQFMGHLKDELTLPHFLRFLDEYCLVDEQLEFIREGGKELADYAIKEKISDALANGFIGEVHLAEVLAADPQYKKILPDLWQKFQLYIRDTKEPDTSTFGKRVLVWNKLLLRWTNGTIQGAPGGREHTLLKTLKSGAIELQTLKDFFERWKIPLPSSLCSSTDKNSAEKNTDQIGHELLRDIAKSGELDRIHAAVSQKGYKYYGSDHDEHFMKLALSGFDGSSSKFKYVKRQYLEDSENYAWTSGKEKRHLIGKLIQRIFMGHDLGKENYQKLYKEYWAYKKK